MEDLSNIPGIGLKLSQKIVAYRNRYGYFSKIADIKNVKGIGEKKFKKIKKYLAVTANFGSDK